MALQFGRKEARQLAVLTQLLDAIRPTDVVDRVDRLTLPQIDPTAAIARSAELIPWGRLGPHTSPLISHGARAERTLSESGGVRSLPERMPT